MSQIYDNWERLVAATLKRDELWELFHQHSRTPSICSEASDFNSSFRLDPDVPFGTSTSASSSKYQQYPEFDREAFIRLVLARLGLAYSSVRYVSWDFLGKGRLGSAYKATLNGNFNVAATVVKKLELVCISEKEFTRRMEVVGKARRENVCALRGYGYLEGENQALVWYDYYNGGSVSSMLRVKTGRIQIPLDWETRLKIAVGAASGICYIHKQKLVHGNIKSSNIFLNEQQYGCVSEMGLATLMENPNTVPAVIIDDGYCAPEVKVTKKVTQDSDVYSFGVFLLELLTGMSPNDKFGFNNAVPFVRWSLCMIREEGSGYFLFDLNPEPLPLPVTRQVQTREEIMEVLQLSMSCLQTKPKSRPSMDAVSKVIKRVHEKFLDYFNKDIKDKP